MSRFVKPIIPETLVHDTHQEPPLFPDVPTLTGNIDKKNQEIKVTGDISIDKLLPITQRQMQQSLRRLCRRVREGVADELDVKATVNEIAVKGILSNLVLKASRVNRAELILLIDREGSMIPFHIASNHLVEIALHSSGFSKNKVKVYYFHNYPNKSELYLNHTNKNDKILLNEIINNIHPHYTSVLIFSDSGAARKKEKKPTDVERREKLTKDFIEQLKSKLNYIVWINPIPKERWKGTSAEFVSQLIPMFEFNHQELEKSMKVLQGKTFY